MNVVNVTDTILHDVLHLQQNIDRIGALNDVGELINFNYTAICFLLSHFIICQLCCGHHMILCLRLRVASFASSVLLWSHRCYAESFVSGSCRFGVGCRCRIFGDECETCFYLVEFSSAD